MKNTFLLLLLALACACEATPETAKSTAETAAATVPANGFEWINDSWTRPPKFLLPLFGYRFVISGDFNGDGQQEQLTEHFMSGLTNRETNKYFDGLADYEELVRLTVQQEPVSVVLSDNSKIPPLEIGSGGQLLGLSYLKNEET